MKLKATTFGLVILAGLCTPDRVTMKAHAQAASEPELRQYSAVVKIVLDKKRLAEFGLKPAHVDAAISNSSVIPSTLAELQSIVITSINDKPIKLANVATFNVEIENKAAAIAAPQARLIYDAKGRPGLQVSGPVVKSLGIEVVAAQRVTTPQPLPPQIGTLQYDTDRLFVIRSRVDGEIVEIGQVDQAPDPAKPDAKPAKRPLRCGDRVKAGALLAVIYSRELGQAKAALVDALLTLRLSHDHLERLRKLADAAVVSESTVRSAERQLLVDQAAVFTAERALRFMKLTDNAIQAVRDEAKALGEAMKGKEFVRDAKAEALKWATVEIRVPKLSDDPRQELTIVERNIGLGDLVDTRNSPPLFKLADPARLGALVPFPEEYRALVCKILAARARIPGCTHRISRKFATEAGAPALHAVPAADGRAAARAAVCGTRQPQGQHLPGRPIGEGHDPHAATARRRGNPDRGAQRVRRADTAVRPARPGQERIRVAPRGRGAAVRGRCVGSHATARDGARPRQTRTSSNAIGPWSRCSRAISW